MKRINTSCDIYYEPVCSMCGVQFVPFISCETKRQTRMHLRKSRK